VSADGNVKLVVEFDLAIEKIDDMLGGAGISHWGSWHAITAAGTHNGTIFDRYEWQLLDKHEHDVDSKKRFRYKLSLEQVLSGLAVCAREYPHHFRDFIADTGDANTGNVIIQCAIFGKLKYV
jgi:hypothetical protein